MQSVERTYLNANEKNGQNATMSFRQSRRDFVNRHVSSISDEQRRKMREEAEKELEQIAILKKNLRDNRKMNLKGYFVITGLGALLTLSEYSVISTFHNLGGKNPSPVLTAAFTAGLLAFVLLPIKISDEFHNFRERYPSGMAKVEIKRARRRLQKLAFDENKKEDGTQ